MFRKAALQRRCLILSSEFYEWRHLYRLNKRTNQPLKTADKYPYHIGLKNKDYFLLLQSGKIGLIRTQEKQSIPWLL
ncbi:hypothetical protein EJ377_01015 [Chryseobacterium arthrosphaerae]|uniref:Uncharacterized protein n=1 Tax=Chryseobacterium arthrosphaerae TaxID=651561 RepID=A0A3S0QVF3_9FLAO|nr:hypothetical protein EJ377_01015 [Chryseobacterium arthrosphaerae]